ncbi:spore germination protein [Paenibacillus taiwanensis]|uniref:spore germination protein n=1 Tax=Paenibacillus taiwanensis TaxID=401638 RepID=UPI00042565DF|nr:spore germination protein [Paenibacillus taiwanensis]
MNENPTNVPSDRLPNQVNELTPLTIQALKQHLLTCSDIHFHTCKYKTMHEEIEVVFAWCEGMADLQQFNQYIIPRFRDILQSVKEVSHLDDHSSLSLIPLASSSGLLQAEARLFDGHLLVCFPEDECYYSIDIAKPPNRAPEESSTEISIKGPKDGFTESLTTNIALVRKRMKSDSLKVESLTIGRRTHTDVALLYIKDIANPELVADVRQRLNRLDIDALISSSQLGDAIGDSQYALFPLLDYIGRPDHVIQSLVRGRFIIMVDTTPMALIGPADLMLVLKSPEDAHFPYYFVTFQRMLRLVGLFVSIFVPGFWIALIAFNVEQLPLPLLATVTNARSGLPFSASMELVLMLGLFEIFREAGVRLPKAVGQTVAVVGGLIVGDASIRAGLGSPTTLVVAAVTAVATFTLVNQSLSGTVSVIRLGVVVLSSFLGMYGFFIAMLAILLYLSTLESFGIPYLAPLSPPSLHDIAKSLIELPSKWKNRRPEYIFPLDKTREGDKG